MWGFILRSIVALAVGMALLIVIGSRTSADLGASAGTAGAGALAWAFAFSRIRRGPFALPPLLSIAGVVVFSLSLVAAAWPHRFYLPQWIHSQRVHSFADGDRVLGDERDKHVAAFIDAHPRYRRAFAKLLGVERACPVDVVIPANNEQYALYAKAARLDGADMGFAYVPPLGRRVVMHAPGRGWGGITHHLALHHVHCTMPHAPPWLANGVAALVEKHTLTHADEFVLRYRSNWRVPESTLSSPVRDFNVELFRGDDQGFLRALFLYLNERGHLRPLLERVRNGDDAVAALAAVTGKGPRALEADWRAWLESEARAIPMLDAAKPEAASPDL